MTARGGVARVRAVASAAGVGALVVLAGCTAGAGGDDAAVPSDEITGLTGASGQEPSVTVVDASWVIDVHDVDAVVAHADEVFVGTVADRGRSSYVQGDPMPVVDFDVTVHDRLKGSPGRQVAVSQEGGRSADGRTSYVFEDDALLTEGDTYLFAVVKDGADRRVIPVGGDQELGSRAVRERVVDEVRSSLQRQHRR